MTAILKDLRALDDRLARGDLGPAAYSAERAALIDNADIIDTDFVDVTTKRPTPSAPTSQPPSGANPWGLGLIICLSILGICLVVAMLTFADFNLALTLGVTILAALTVTLLRNLEE